MKVLISGGGTGGHIFPAVSIANAIRELEPDTEFLFIGALGRMEMEKVPAEGDRIIGVAKLVEVKTEENTEAVDDSGDIRAGSVEADVQLSCNREENAAEQDEDERAFHVVKKGC